MLKNIFFQGIWLDDVMTWVENHLKEKLDSDGNIFKTILVFSKIKGDVLLPLEFQG